MPIKSPYLLFIGDAADHLAAKTARGIVDWRPDGCLGQLRLPGCQTDLGLPDLTLFEAAAAGCETMVVGVANRGGVIPNNWVATLTGALEQGMDIASGLHTRLRDIEAVRQAADRLQRNLFDVRHPDRDFSVGLGSKRPGKRLLTVGTDASVGKMYTTLAIEKELRERSVKVTFRATGQTGIFIAGDGVSVDAVVADFISGATEWLCPANEPDHWDVVEGQGSLFHPSFAGVTLGLIHGAQPDFLILCHEPTRTHMRGLPHWPPPDVEECLAANLAAARLTNPAARCVGASVNTSALSDDEAEACVVELGLRLNMPCVDPMRMGVGPLVDCLLA